MMARLSSFALRGSNGLWIGLVLFMALVAGSWIGFLGSDDVTYSWGAYGWLEEFPYVGGHGTIRYLLTVPMALSFLAFGENEYAMVLPSLLYTLGFLWLAWRAVRDASGAFSALGALLVLVTSPLLVIQASLSGVDVVEMFYLFASVFLFWRCLEDGPRAWPLFGAGMLAGCGFLIRETAIFVAVFYALMFFKGHGFHRKHYMWIPAGFLTVWLMEVLYLWIMTGDPLYRINISLHHDASIDRSIDLAGNVIAHPLIDPLLVLMFNQEFMALFFLAVPAGIWLCLGKGAEPKLRHFCRIIALFGLTWFVCAGAAQKLLPLNPRYFLITAAVACILLGIAMARLLAGGATRVRLGVAAAALLLFGGNLAGIYVENKDPVFGERTLAEIAARYPGQTLHTDPMTRYRADTLLRWERARDRVVASPPQTGDLYFHNPARADTANFKMPEAQRALFQPQPGWEKVASFETEPSYLASALEMTGIAARLPEGIWKKLRHRHPAVALYRVR